MKIAPICKKCGSNETQIKYHKNEYGCIHTERYDSISCVEHLHVLCLCCEYTWCIPTLDSNISTPVIQKDNK